MAGEGWREAARDEAEKEAGEEVGGEAGAGEAGGVGEEGGEEGREGKGERGEVRDLGAEREGRASGVVAEEGTGKEEVGLLFERDGQGPFQRKIGLSKE